MKSRREKYRRFLKVVLGATLVFSLFYSHYYLETMIPNRIHVVVDEEGTFNFRLPVGGTLKSDSEEVLLGASSNIPRDQIDLTLNENFNVYSGSLGSYTLSLKLFGIFDFKDINVDVVEQKYVTPGGMPIGIYLKTDGIMAIGTGKVTDLNGDSQDPAYGIIKSGDYIVSADGTALEEKEDLIRAVSGCGGEDVVLTIRRDENLMDVKIKPVCTGEDDYKIGVWVRDDTHGIGTLTFMDEDGGFGALGHGISDSDTGQVIEIEDGLLYRAQIHSIIKGTIGSPGSMAGSIDYSPDALLGEIKGNTDTGVYGKGSQNLKDALSSNVIPIGYSQDVKLGDASILCCVDGQIREYGIQIIRLDSPNKKTKSMVIEVTDKRLKEITGGIVQGMSGSPIIQNGKLIGAVTHVFVQDSTRGYGIFIENMMEH